MYPTEKESYIQLNVEFQRIARRDKKTFLNKQCKENCHTLSHLIISGQVYFLPLLTKEPVLFGVLFWRQTAFSSTASY